MTQKQKSRAIASLLINLVIIVLEVIGLVLSIQGMGWGLFEYYTQDSNILGLIACLIYAGYTIAALRRGESCPPVWVKRLKYIATCCLMVTFIVVITVLAPTMGGYGTLLFDGAMLYHHTLCPLLALLGLLLFEGEPKLERRDALYALIPTALYAIVAIILNLLHVIDGPYPFLKVNSQPVWMSIMWAAVILGGAYGVAWLVRVGSNRLGKR